MHPHIEQQAFAGKHEAYRQAIGNLEALLATETNIVLKMSTINCILRDALPYYFWVGFYCVENGALVVGPYQGTLGCLHIQFGRGVCGRAALQRQTQIVADVHADPNHIACDARSQSEIVVPVFDAQQQLIAVFDVDSDKPASFDETDQLYLEQILNRHFAQLPITISKYK